MQSIVEFLVKKHQDIMNDDLGPLEPSKDPIKNFIVRNILPYINIPNNIEYVDKLIDKNYVRTDNIHEYIIRIKGVNESFFSGKIKHGVVDKYTRIGRPVWFLYNSGDKRHAALGLDPKKWQIIYGTKTNSRLFDNTNNFISTYNTSFSGEFELKDLK